MLETVFEHLLDQRLIDALPGAVGVADLEGKVIRTNPALYALFRLEPASGYVDALDFVATESLADAQVLLQGAFQ